jgi:hypothetical protein
MKSIFMRSVYAGLGLLGTGTETVEQLGRKLAKKAAVSEKEGERIARRLQVQSAKAFRSVQQMMDQESKKVIHAVRAATTELSRPTEKRTRRRRSTRKTSSHSGSHSSK